jgi:twitching motility protein PilT
VNDLAVVRIADFLRTARARGASDAHFGGSDRPALRIDGRMVVLDGPTLPDPAVRAFLEATLPPEACRHLDTCGTADGAQRTAVAGGYRIHAFRHHGGTRVVVRLLAPEPPHLESLQLPSAIADLAHRPAGLILFTGPSGSGKTTALAALIDRINRTLERSILTVEDPIEYLHTSSRSLLTQCEIGRDVSDYAEAIRGFMRADPDVILIGEMRDRETMEAALTAAETGHLVLTTLHTNDAPQTIDRIVDAFPSNAQGQVRSQLAAVLVAVVSLRLIVRASGNGRCAAAEIMIGSDAIRAMIRDAKTHQLRNAIVTGRNFGMQTLESHLAEMAMRGEITLDAARAASVHPSEVLGRGRSMV